MKRLLVFLAIFSIAVAACSGGGSTGTTAVPSGDGNGGGTGIAAEGEKVFASTCVACHGSNAEGVTGLGPALSNNAFVQANSDEDLVAFLVVGRAADDPANQSGIAMPARGGNPSLTDSDLLDVTAYLRTLQP